MYAMYEQSDDSGEKRYNYLMQRAEAYFAQHPEKDRPAPRRLTVAEARKRLADLERNILFSDAAHATGARGRRLRRLVLAELEAA